MSFDLGPAQERSRKVAEQMNRGIASLFKKNKVTHVQGYGQLTGKGMVEVEADGKKTTLRAEHVILATGSRPKDLPFLQIDEDRVISSTGALDPEGGARLARHRRGGRRRRRVRGRVQRLRQQGHDDRGARSHPTVEDADCSAVVEKAFKKRGIDVFTGARLEKAEIHERGVKVTFKDRKGEARELEVDRVLSAVGRAPNSEDLGLDAAGVKTERGFIVIDERMRTNVPGIYGIGDCAGNQLLAHKAATKASCASSTSPGRGTAH